MNLTGYTAQTYTIIRKKLIKVITGEIPISENDGMLGIVSVAKGALSELK